MTWDSMQRPGTRPEKQHVAALPNDARFTNDKTPPPHVEESGAGSENEVDPDVAPEEHDDDMDESPLSLPSDVEFSEL